MTFSETKRWFEEPPADESEARAARSLAAYAQATADTGPSAETRARLARSVAAAGVEPRRRTRTVALSAAVVIGVGLAAAATLGPWRAKPTVATTSAPSVPTPPLASPRRVEAPFAPSVAPLAPSVTASVAPDVHDKPVSTPQPTPRSTSSSLQLESQALARAVAALRREGKPDRALALLDEYRDAFPRGALSLEASVVRVDALMALGRRREALAVLERLPLDKMPRGVELRKLRDNLVQGR